MSAPVTPRDPAEVGARVRARLGALRFVGELSEDDAAARGLRLIETAHGAEHAADHIRLTMLVDDQGVVRDARYRTLAVAEQLVAYDVMAEQCVGLPLDEAARTITPASVERTLRDAPAAPAYALPAEADRPFYVLRKADERLHGARHDTPPAAAGASPAQQLPWSEVGLFEKVRRIEAVLDEHVRPALASDGGGIDLVDLQGENLMVQYHGACGSCSSSIGGTLMFIQDSLNNHLATTLTVKVTGIDDESAPFMPV